MAPYLISAHSLPVRNGIEVEEEKGLDKAPGSVVVELAPGDESLPYSTCPSQDPAPNLLSWAFSRGPLLTRLGRDMGNITKTHTRHSHNFPQARVDPQ